MKFLILTLLSLCAGSAFANVEMKRIITPRGEAMEVAVHKANRLRAPVIVIAPGQSCNARGPLFEAIGKTGSLSGFNVVRFEWAYCLKDPNNPEPSPDLKNETEDFFTVLQFTKTLKDVDLGKTVIAGKSLGSLVAYKVFQSFPLAKALVLLTPVCTYTTDDQGKTLPAPLKVCDKHYPALKQEVRPVYMAMGDQDNYCILNVLFDFLKDSSGNINVSVAGGEHGFRIYKADGKTLDDEKTTRNIQTVVSGVLNWIDLKVSIQHSVSLRK